MKRALFALMIVVAVFSIAGAGSLAYFSDDEAATGNTFEVGVWATEVGTGELFVADPAAGDTGTETWTAATIGTVPEYLDLENIQYAETGPGHLGDYLLVHLFLDYDGNGSFDIGDATIYGPGAPVSFIAPSYDLNFPVEGGAAAYITLNWMVIDTYVPCAGDAVALSITFEFQLQPED